MTQLMKKVWFCSTPPSAKNPASQPPVASANVLCHCRRGGACLRRHGHLPPGCYLAVVPPAVEEYSHQDRRRELLVQDRGVGSKVLTGMDNRPSADTDPAVSSIPATTTPPHLSFIISSLTFSLTGEVTQETFVSYSPGFIQNVLICQKPFPFPQGMSCETQVRERLSPSSTSQFLLSSFFFLNLRK